MFVVVCDYAGCFECSRRRIDCDRGTPKCQKCLQRGIACSGLGIRYRFNDGLASRGRLVGQTLPTTSKPRYEPTPIPTWTPNFCGLILGTPLQRPNGCAQNIPVRFSSRSSSTPWCGQSWDNGRDPTIRGKPRQRYIALHLVILARRL